MRDLDETDRDIIRLLLADARRPYADIAEEVDLSGPAVSDRVGRLQELGVVRRFTVDLDRSALRDGVRVLVECSVRPDAVDDLRAALAGTDPVEHLLETAGGDLLATATVPDGRVREHLPLGGAEDVSVRPLAASSWHPSVGEASLGLTCVECGNTVTSEGMTATVGGQRREFCCPSCRERFEDRYAELEEGV